MVSMVAKQMAFVTGLFLFAAWFGYSSGYDLAIRPSASRAVTADATLQSSPETTCWRMRADGSWSPPWRGRGSTCFSADEVR